MSVRPPSISPRRNAAAPSALETFSIRAPRYCRHREGANFMRRPWRRGSSPRRAPLGTAGSPCAGGANLTAGRRSEPSTCCSFAGNLQRIGVASQAHAPGVGVERLRPISLSRSKRSASRRTSNLGGTFGDLESIRAFSFSMVQMQSPRDSGALRQPLPATPKGNAPPHLAAAEGVTPEGVLLDLRVGHRIAAEVGAGAMDHEVGSRVTLRTVVRVRG